MGKPIRSLASLGMELLYKGRCNVMQFTAKKLLKSCQTLFQAGAREALGTRLYTGYADASCYHFQWLVEACHTVWRTRSSWKHQVRSLWPEPSSWEFTTTGWRVRWLLTTEIPFVFEGVPKIQSSGVWVARGSGSEWHIARVVLQMCEEYMWPHTAPFLQVQWSAATSNWVTGSGDCTVRLWVRNQCCIP